MQLTPIKANMTEVILKSGQKILFSYKTPVALYEPRGQHYIVTSKHWSATTTRHINAWIAPLNTKTAMQESQEWFDGLLDKLQYEDLNNAGVK